MKHSHAPAPVNPPEVEDELVRLGQAIADAQREIAQAEGKHASLVAEDATLVAAINENGRTAAIPEPKAVDFAKVDEWHSATRKWAANRARVDGALPGLEAERNRKVLELDPATRHIGDHRFNLAQLELDRAKLENVVAQQHAKQVAARVDHFQRALWTAREAS